MVNKELETKLPKKQANMLLITTVLLMLSITLDTLMRAKDMAIFDLWFSQLLNEGIQATREEAFSLYVTSTLSRYFFFILVPMAFGIHTFFAYMKFRINKLFIFIWTVLMAGGLAYTVFEKAFTSIFYYINIGLYIVVILTILTLVEVVSQNKKL